MALTYRDGTNRFFFATKGGWDQLELPDENKKSLGNNRAVKEAVLANLLLFLTFADSIRTTEITRGKFSPATIEIRQSAT